jgi:hypothetical protein
MSIMFYEARPSDAIRFGDILSGFVLAFSSVPSPNLAAQANTECQIAVSQPNFCASLTPCCTIARHRNNSMSLAPLIRVQPGFFDNEHIRDDLTLLNSPLRPEESVSRQLWDSLSQVDRARKFDLRHEKSYAFTDYFIYAQHPLLPRYKLPHKSGGIETGYYMIDFKQIVRVDCDKITSALQDVLKAKVLQLSIGSRSSLRDKLSKYFARVPDEDSV